MPRIYLDVCCLNRPYDDQAQDRICLESEAVLLILAHVEAGEWQWTSSEIVDFEIARTPDAERQSRVRFLTRAVQNRVELESGHVERARELAELGFRAVDALYLACAESGDVEVFLTTDDRLLRLTSRHAARLRVRVDNPLGWLREVTQA